MPTNPSKLLDRLTPAFQGAIWIGCDELDNKIPGFLELNYIFDGLISQSIHKNTAEQMKLPLSFFTKSFGQHFFLYYFNQNVIFPIITPTVAEEGKNKILIINTNPSLIIQIETFATQLPAFQFELLDLF
jgi:hypothetical protein